MKPIIDKLGTQFWYNNDLLHRDNDLPAIIYKDGTQRWYNNNKLHRDNDLPAIINADGTQCWFINGVLHRLYKPAVIYNGNQWFINGIHYWFINGKDITEEVNDFIKEYDLPEWSEWTEGHRILFRMRF